MIFKKRILYNDWVWSWLATKKDYIKESTYANYATTISNHIAVDLGKYYLDELDNKLLQNYLIEKYKNGRVDKTGGLSGKTIKDIIAIIRNSLKSAAKEGLIPHIALDFVYPKSPSKEKIYALTRGEQRKLTNYILKNRNNRSIGILLALYSGMRIGEICALQWKDIDFRKNVIHITKTIQRVYIKDKEQRVSKIIITTPKTQHSEREIPISKGFSLELKKYKTHYNDYILSGTNKWVEPRTYRRFFDRILKKAKIDRINFHGLRHTFASNCIKLGVDYKTVSELLGHSTVNITLNLYVHPQMSQKKRCIDLICKNFSETCGYPLK